MNGMLERWSFLRFPERKKKKEISSDVGYSGNLRFLLQILLFKNKDQYLSIFYPGLSL